MKTEADIKVELNQTLAERDALNRALSDGEISADVYSRLCEAMSTKINTLRWVLGYWDSSTK